MDRRLFVHLGMRKTGSKALQTALRTASGVDFVYPLLQDKQLWHQTVHYGLQELNTAPLDEALTHIGCAPVGILSYEAFHELDDRSLALLAERTSDTGRGISAVIFLRRQDEYVASLINQFWKAHRVSYAQAEENIAALLNGTTSLDYEQLLDRLSIHFTTIIPIIYDKRQSTVRQFATATGIRLATPSDGSDPNPAASAVEIATLKEVKRLVGDDPRLPEIVEATRHALIEPGIARRLAARRDGPATTLDPAMAEAIMQRYATSNQRLRERWFAERKQLFSPSYLPSPRREAEARDDVVRKIRREFQF